MPGLLVLGQRIWRDEPAFDPQPFARHRCGSCTEGADMLSNSSSTTLRSTDTGLVYLKGLSNLTKLSKLLLPLRLPTPGSRI